MRAGQYSRVQYLANQLKLDTPLSEKWFMKKLKSEIFYGFFGFEENYPFCSSYILDLISCKYRIAIEVDGSFHDRADQKAKDIKKDEYMTSKKYRVIRVRAYDEGSYAACIAVLNGIYNKHTIKDSVIEEPVRIDLIDPNWEWY